MSLAESRRELARRQAALLQDLTGRGTGLTGVDRLEAAATALMKKRMGAVARAWPALARSLGDRFEPSFRDFARRTPLPDAGGPLADGRAFAREIHDLSDEARLELLSVDLHGKRRWKAVWLRETGRLVVGARLPWLGVYWVWLPLPAGLWRTAHPMQREKIL